jgi:Uncharacterised nucleotidyltransferase
VHQSDILLSSRNPFEPFVRWLGPNDIADPAAYDAAGLGRFIQTYWHLSPFLVSRLPGDFPEHPELEIARETATITSLHGEFCAAEMGRIAALLDGEGIPYALLKSAASRWICFDDPAHRCGRDIDLAVPAEQIEQARGLFLQAGYQQALWDENTRTFNSADPSLTVLVESAHHELGFLVMVREVEDLSSDLDAAIRKQIARRSLVWTLDESDRILHYTVLDLHHGLSLEIDVGPSVRHAETIETEYGRLHIQPRDWQLFYLVFKLYWEGVHRYRLGGYQYAELTRLPALLDAEGIDRFCARVEDWNLEAAAYFTLRRLPLEFFVELPDALFEKILAWGSAPTGATPKECNDYGDVWHKLWGGR